jgi:plasmid rolling circle replication initiator protein Rep
MNAHVDCTHDLLVDYSPTDRPWDVHKAGALALAEVLASVGYARLRERLDGCADLLMFGWADAADGSSALKLRNAWFCRCRVCPVCSWRRSLMWKARFFQALPGLLEQYPKHRWLMLTLTVRNCQVGDLGATLSAMNSAWKRLIMRPEFQAVTGWIRTTEVTRGADGSAHPHYHVLLMVPSSWFGRHYTTQGRWTAMWQECMRIDYQPMVDVRTVKANKRRPLQPEGGVPGELAAAAAEVLKYATKPADLLGDTAWLETYLQQTHKRRFIAAGGVLKGFMRERPGDDLINVDGSDQDDRLPDDGSRLAFGYDRQPKVYRRAPGKDRERKREPGDDDEE